MLSRTTIERATGILLMLMSAVVVAATLMNVGVDTYDTTPGESMRQIVDNPGLFKASVAAKVSVGILGVIVSVLMYSVFHGRERTLALVGTFGFLLLGVSFMGSAYASSGLSQMAKAYENASGPQATIIAASARPLSHLTEAAVFGGIATSIPLSLLAFGTLIAWTVAMPRWLGLWGVVAGALMLAILGSDLSGIFWAVGMIGLMGGLAWLLATGAWLVVRGTRGEANQAYSPTEQSLQPAF